VKRISTLAFVLVGIAAAVALVILIAPNANANPDGLEKVAAEKGIDREVRDHDLAGGPFADYGVSGVDNRYVGTWISGLLGVAVTFAIGAGIVYVVRRSRRPQTPPPPPAGPPVTA
jgi:cobalt/nickel transport system permease protein